MGRFIKNILLFLFLALIIYPFLIILTGYYMSPHLGVKYVKGSFGHTYSRLCEVKTTKNVEILFCGSSLTYRGFDTRIFKEHGFTSFNLGSSGQTHIQTEVLLKRYLDQLHPKIIIYEVNPLIFTDEGIESALDIVSNDRNDLESLKMSLELNNLLVYNTLFFAFYIDLFVHKSPFIENKKKGGDTYIEGGFVEKEPTCFKKVNYKKSTLKFNNKQFEAFKKCLSILSEKNVKIVLVFAPITKSLYESYNNKDVFENKMKKYVNYYDFNKMIQLDDSLNFYDSEHLNQSGVVLFNNKLLEVLEADKLINASTLIHNLD